MKNEKIKEILKSKKGKVIISFCAVTVLAAAIIAAVAININLKPQKELILKHGTLEENVITASDTAAERSSTSTNNINTSSSSASTTKTDQSPGTPKDKSSDAPKDQSPGTSKDKSNDAPKNQSSGMSKDKSSGKTTNATKSNTSSANKKQVQLNYQLLIHRFRQTICHQATFIISTYAENSLNSVNH